MVTVIVVAAAVVGFVVVVAGFIAKRLLVPGPDPIKYLSEISLYDGIDQSQSLKEVT